MQEYSKKLLIRIGIMIYPILAGVLHGQSAANIIDATRRTDWTVAGVPGGIPTGRTLCGTVSPYGSSGSPLSSSTIQNAFNGCSPNTYLQLGAGDFWLSDGMTLAANQVSLVGSGADKTKLHFVSTGAGCNGFGAKICIPSLTGMDSSSPQNIANVTGASQGSTSITIGTITGNGIKPTAASGTIGTSSYVPGTIIYIDVPNDGTTRAQDTGNLFACDQSPVCVQSGNDTSNGSGRSSRHRVQAVSVTSITAGTCTDGAPCTATIEPPIMWPNFGTNAQAWWGGNNGPNTLNHYGIGIENLSVIDATGVSQSSTIQMFGTWGTWVKGVRIVRMSAEAGMSGASSIKQVNSSYSLHTEVRDNYFVGRVSTDNYGVDCQICSAYKVENNIFQRLGVPLQIENGTGLVYSYNWVPDNTWGGPCCTWIIGSPISHSTQAAYVLAEGNDAIGWEGDNYFGTAQFGTLNRNRFRGTQTNMGQGNATVSAKTVAVNNQALGRFLNAVNNVLGTPGYHTNYQGVANDGNCPWGGSNAYCEKAIWLLGYGAIGSGNGTNYPLDDNLTVTTALRWCNWDSVTNGVRCLQSETPNSGGTGYNSLYTSAQPASQYNLSSGGSLPNSFYYTVKPSWWGTTYGSSPWPAIGADVIGGNIANTGGHANKIPARVMWENAPTDMAFGADYTPTSVTCTSGVVTLTFGSNLPADVTLEETISVTGLSVAAYNTDGASGRPTRVSITGGGSIDGTANQTNYVKYLVPNGGSCSGSATGGTMHAPSIVAFNASGYVASSSPTVTLDNTSHDFGGQVIGVPSSSFVFTLQNTGSDVLAIGSITPSGDFAESSNCPMSPATLGIGSTCTITTTFTPTQAGVRSGSILIADNASDTPQTISLNGTGLTGLVGSIGTGITAGLVIIR